MLLNFSNHSYKNFDDTVLWDKEQENAALLQFGDIIDYYRIDSELFDLNKSESLKSPVSFPPIDPLWSESEVYDKSLYYAYKIEENNIKHVYIVGEYNFIFVLINLLQNKGIDCYASATYRDPFKFIQFRKYHKFNYNE